jgi:hypothetical protein
LMIIKRSMAQNGIQKKIILLLLLLLPLHEKAI